MVPLATQMVTLIVGVSQALLDEYLPNLKEETMATVWFVLVVTSVICGFLANRWAKKSGRNPALWTAVAVIFNVFGFAVLATQSKRQIAFKQARETYGTGRKS